jgi:hypothetical protein
MNQRTDTRTAIFVRPKFWQMIKRQLDGHNGLLAQPLDSHEAWAGAIDLNRPSLVCLR